MAGGKKAVSKPFKAWQAEIITLDFRSQSQGTDEIGVYFPFTGEQFDAHGTHLGNYVGSGAGRYYVFQALIWPPKASL